MALPRGALAARPYCFLSSTAWGPAAPEGPGLCSRCLSLHLGQVRPQVVGESPVASPEHLRLGGLVILHDAETVVVGVEVHDLVVAHCMVDV